MTDASDQLNRFFVSGQEVLSPVHALEAARFGAIFIDVRDTYHTDYKQYDVPQCLICPPTEFEQFLEKLDRNGWYVVADVSGTIIRSLYDKMKVAGFSHVVMLGGGFVLWERLGLPILVDKHRALSGSCVCQLKYRNLKK